MPYQPHFEPTRAGLLGLRSRLKMARKAHKILNMKLDGLILEVLKLAPKMKEKYALINKQYKDSQSLIAAAYMIEGTVNLTVASYSVEVSPEVNLTIKNAFGVKIPQITGPSTRTDVIERGYGLLGTSLVVDDLADSYEDLIVAIIAFAEMETSLKHLLNEIKRISRRVKSLEHQVIPTLEETERSLSRMRDEIEREETNRLFHIKKMKERQEGDR
jgi:V/A-type H+/Na+-transporting ATPase subunit D